MPRTATSRTTCSSSRACDPVTDTGSGGTAIQVDFTTAAGGLAAGYIRDFGQPFGARTGADQGSGLTYGWKDLATENDVNISVGGTIPGNARDRNSAQADVRLDSFMHMLPTDVPQLQRHATSTRSGRSRSPTARYDVTVGVGDPNVGADAEVHTINVEGVTVRRRVRPDRRRRREHAPLDPD